MLKKCSNLYPNCLKRKKNMLFYGQMRTRLTNITDNITFLIARNVNSGFYRFPDQEKEMQTGNIQRQTVFFHPDGSGNGF